MPERISFLLPELSDRKDCVVEEMFLDLYEEHLEYKCVADYAALQEDDVSYEDVRSNYRWIRKRSNISEVSMYFDNPEGMWMLTLDFAGVGDKIGWYFEQPKEALATYKKLKDYWLRP